MGLGGVYRVFKQAVTKPVVKWKLFLYMCSVLEVAVVGPPELFRVGFNSVGPLATMTMAWVRSENNLARLLPICFSVNTMR